MAGLKKGQKHSGSFKPGNKMGQGRKKLPKDIREARNMSYEEMCRTVIEVRNMTPIEVEKLNLKKEPLGKRAIMNAFVKLDYRGIKDYEDRLWGRAQENIDLTSNQEQILTSSQIILLNSLRQKVKNKKKTPIIDGKDNNQ